MGNDNTFNKILNFIQNGFRKKEVKSFFEVQIDIRKESNKLKQERENRLVIMHAKQEAEDMFMQWEHYNHSNTAKFYKQYFNVPYCGLIIPRPMHTFLMVYDAETAIHDTDSYRKIRQEEFERLKKEYLEKN